MIVLDGQIKLNKNEIESFKQDTGLNIIPDTVEEYNQHLQNAADYWRSSIPGDTCSELLAELIEAEKIIL
ncbi:MAG: hypothetical protein KGI54_14600 [Pseudomonadota bacterium]|nr:hypothetical protein [Pseudomonadota bacterium]